MKKDTVRPSDRFDAQVLAFYRSLAGGAPRRAGVQRFRSLEELNASRSDPYRR